MAEQREYQKKIHPSFDIATFYNYATEGGCRLKINLWSDKIGLIFSTWDAQTKTSKEEKVWIAYDLLILLEGVLKDIMRQRIDDWRNKRPYKEFAIPLENTYFDKEGAPHTTGILTLRTVTVAEESGAVQRFQLHWHSEAYGDFFITVGNKLIPRITAKAVDVVATLDPFDAAFYRFVMVLSKISSNAVVYSIGCKLAEMIGNLSGGLVDERPSGGNRQPYNNSNRGGQDRGNQRPSGPFRTQAQVEDKDIQF